ncbi:MAG: NmrA family NAD(P)-binding protein [Alphaproteobacteria bacterium]|jgi:uncharacterized protein YbjT (DUF2867 family)|nr:NmrA family NAD(P)-binding protein [Alphaproteobacteria bacterium]
MTRARSDRVLVTGATGNVGRAVVAALTAQGHAPLRGLRQTETDGDVALDFLQPQTWPGALDGVGALFLMRPPAIADMGKTLIPFLDMARARGVDRIVFLSVIGADRARWVPHHAVERHLRDGPADWTILRAGFFAQNLHDAYRRDIVEDGRLYVPAGQGRAAFVDAADLGYVAALALAGRDLRGHILTLTGPEALDFDQVARLLSRRLGRSITYDAATILGYMRHLRRRGLPWMATLVQTYLHVGLRFGQARQVTQDIPRLLDRPATPLDDVVARDRATWRCGTG